jgi:hypothetical protein
MEHAATGNGGRDPKQAIIERDSRVRFLPIKRARECDQRIQTCFLCASYNSVVAVAQNRVYAGPGEDCI